MTHIKSVISSKTAHVTEPSKDTHALLQHAEKTSFNIATDNAKNEPASESLHNVMQSDKQQSNYQAATNAENNHEENSVSTNKIKRIISQHFCSKQSS